MPRTRAAYPTTCAGENNPIPGVFRSGWIPKPAAPSLSLPPRATRCCRPRRGAARAGYGLAALCHRSLVAAIAVAMKKGQAGLRRFAMDLDGDPVVLAIVGGAGRLIADDILIVNLACHGGGGIGDAAVIVDSEGASSGEFGDFVP